MDSKTKYKASQIGYLAYTNNAIDSLNFALKHLSLSDFIFTLNNIVVAQLGFENLSQKTGLGRQSLYKTLTPSTDPHISTILRILEALDFEIQIVNSKKSVIKEKISLRLNSLAQIYPEIAKEWHISKNIKFSPNDVMISSRKKVWWQCSQDESHEWCDLIISRSNGQGCPFCKLI